MLSTCVGDVVVLVPVIKAGVFGAMEVPKLLFSLIKSILLFKATEGLDSFLFNVTSEMSRLTEINAGDSQLQKDRDENVLMSGGMVSF